MWALCEGTDSSGWGTQRSIQHKGLFRDWNSPRSPAVMPEVVGRRTDRPSSQSSFPRPPPSSGSLIRSLKLALGLGTPPGVSFPNKDI